MQIFGCLFCVKKKIKATAYYLNLKVKFQIKGIVEWNGCLYAASLFGAISNCEKIKKKLNKGDLTKV